MKRSLLLPVILGMTLSTGVVRGEDVQLRNQAVSLLNRSHIAGQIQGGPYNIRTEVTFTATAADGSLQSGSYVRVRASDGALRQDLRFGDYAASSISQGVQAAWTAGWHDPPYAARKIRQLVPYGPVWFDQSNVIAQIKSSSYGGREAYCIEFETIVGEQRLPGEICIDKATGSLLELRSGNKLWEYSGYFAIKGALMPQHIVYRESNFSLNADLAMTALDEKPEDEFAVPPEWSQGTMCRQFSMPVAKFAPQPKGEGGPDAPITDVAVHLHVSAQGTVSSAEVPKPVNPELDKEAQKLVSTWVYEPGTCNGRAQEYTIDVTVHFQGR